VGEKIRGVTGRQDSSPQCRPSTPTIPHGMNVAAWYSPSNLGDYPTLWEQGVGWRFEGCQHYLIFSEYYITFGAQ